MATTEKVSVSIAVEDLEWARGRARATHRSLSAVLAEALRRQRQSEARAQLLDELGTEDISDEDLAATRDEWR